MSPPDPKAAEGSSEEEDAAPPQAEADVDDLRMRGDVEGLLSLARAYRSGSAAGGRDMKRCLDAYRAAAELGSGDADYAVALFCMNGSVVVQDLKEGTTRLRSAAERGSVAAKVYLGNLYELGIHYKADPEKADVWYRNAARSAKIEGELGSDEHTRALAELGCVRHVLALASRLDVAEDVKTQLIARAKAHGYGLRIRDEASDPGRATFHDALASTEIARTPTETAPATKVTTATNVAAATKKEAPQAKPKVKPEGPSRAALAIGAFGYALLFAVTGLGAAYVATLGAHELVAHGKTLPLIGPKLHLVFPIVFGVVGVLPTWLVYRFGTILKGLFLGGLVGGLGWIAWGTGTGMLHASQLIQAFAFGLGGFLAGLFVFGLLGGTKKQPARVRLSKT